MEHRLVTLWGGWCVAAGHPEIVLSTVRNSGAVRIRCDLDPTGRCWDFASWRSIGRMLYQLQPVERAGWLFTPEELQLEGREREVAITIARSRAARPD
jgi:hypothetical protein